MEFEKNCLKNTTVQLNDGVFLSHREKMWRHFWGFYSPCPNSENRTFYNTAPMLRPISQMVRYHIIDSINLTFDFVIGPLNFTCFLSFNNLILILISIRLLTEFTAAVSSFPY